MELKLLTAIKRLSRYVSFNRTFMELKLAQSVTGLKLNKF